MLTKQLTQLHFICELAKEKEAMHKQLVKSQEKNDPSESKFRFDANINIRQKEAKISELRKQAEMLIPTKAKTSKVAPPSPQNNPILTLSHKTDHKIKSATVASDKDSQKKGENPDSFHK